MNSPDASRQHAEEPVVNKALEDILAIAGGDAEQEALLLRAVMLLCCEKLARAVGRARCRDTLQGMDRFIREASPVRPWRD